jgi:hypothetical protein
MEEVTDKGVKMAFMMNKDAMINSCKIILEKKIFFSKNHCEIQVRTIIVCALHSSKYSTILPFFHSIGPLL